MQFEDFALQTNVFAFVSRSKAKAKPRRRISARSSTRTVPICERSWTDLEPEIYSFIGYPVSKQLSTLRHGHLPREDDGASEFWRLKDYFRNQFEHSQHWSDEMWKSMAEATRKDFNTVLIHQDFFFSKKIQVLEGYSGRNLIDLSLQDNDNFFEFIHHIGCVINLYSITKSGSIPGRQNLSKRRTVFFTSVNPMNKEHRDPNKIHSLGRTAFCMVQADKVEETSKHGVLGRHYKTCQKKGFKFYQLRSNGIIFCDTFPAYCIPKPIVM